MRKNEHGYSRQKMITNEFEIHRKSGLSKSAAQRNCHTFHEIYILLKGNAKFIIEGKTYTLKSGDILFISNNESHYPLPSTSETYERIVIWTNHFFLSSISSGRTDLGKCFDTSIGGRNNLLRGSSSALTLILNHIIRLEKIMLAEDYGSDLLKITIFVELMVALNNLNINNSFDESILDISSNRKINEILSYINTNLASKITLDDLASRFYMSKYHLLREFKKSTGYTVHRYLLQKRLMSARDLLTQNYSINKICELCGFGDHSSFIRTFQKEFGLPPKKYKKCIEYLPYNPFKGKTSINGEE